MEVFLDASEMRSRARQRHDGDGLGHVSLERGPGGLPPGAPCATGESTSRIMGASRGEGGILGEGIRQALLRDHTYGPALEAAGAMLP